MNVKKNIGSITPKPLPVVWKEVRRRMLIVNYQKSTINRFQRSMNFLDAFMQESGYNLYFPSVGEKFLTSSQSLATREKRLLIQHLDLSMVDMFWGEYYSTKQYQFHNKYLKSTLDCLLNDMNMAGIKRYGKGKLSVASVY